MQDVKVLDVCFHADLVLNSLLLLLEASCLILLSPLTLAEVAEYLRDNTAVGCGES